jgi:hypothetical protein
MKHLILLSILALACRASTLNQVAADANSSVSTSLLGYGVPCTATSSGALIACESGTAQVPNLVVAETSATAGYGSLDLFASAGGFGNGYAQSSAAYQEMADFGSATGTVTGYYSLSAASNSTYGPYWAGELLITQGSNSESIQLDSGDLTFSLSSPYHGVPIMIAGSALLEASTPGAEDAQAFISLDSLVFQAGVQTPEPGFGWLVGLGLFVLVTQEDGAMKDVKASLKL